MGQTKKDFLEGCNVSSMFDNRLLHIPELHNTSMIKTKTPTMIVARGVLAAGGKSGSFGEGEG